MSNPLDVDAHESGLADTCHPPSWQVWGDKTQVVRYDDDIGDELFVSLGTTAFVSGTMAFVDLCVDQERFALSMHKGSR